MTAAQEAARGMIDLAAFDRILPATGISADYLASISGHRQDQTLEFWMPPAGWDEPAVDVVAMLRFIRTEVKHLPEAVDPPVEELARSLLAALPSEQRPVMLLEIRGVACCARVSAVARAAATLGDLEARLAWALSALAQRLAYEPLLECCTGERSGLRGKRYSLRHLMSFPAPGGLVETWISGPCYDVAYDAAGDFEPANALVETWRHELSAEIQALGRQVGAKLMVMYETGCDFHTFCDDRFHRYLGLDFICQVAPEGLFVRYLLEVSGTPTVDALRAGLRSPSAYTADFELWDPEYETRPARFEVGEDLAVKPQKRPSP